MIDRKISVCLFQALVDLSGNMFLRGIFMKRNRRIGLILAGILAAGCLGGCTITLPFRVHREEPEAWSGSSSSEENLYGGSYDDYYGSSMDPDEMLDEYLSDSGYSSDSSLGYGDYEDGESAYTEDGSYIIPEGWEMNEEQSTSAKVFYVRDDETDMNQPDNISVEQGTNKYKADDPMSFKNAIMRQLGIMTKGKKCEVHGRGYTTDKGVNVIMLEMIEDTCTTRQYYLCGDNRYVLIHATNFSGATDIDDAAEEMAESFEWMN